MKIPTDALKKTIKILLFICLAFLLFSFIRLMLSLPSLPDNLNDIALSTPTEIYSDKGELITSLNDRQPVALSQMSPYFLKAILAMEDDGFYQHHGLNKRGLFRALFTNMQQGKVVEGGSSITQQLAKNLFLSFKRDWDRKLPEILITLQMERRYTKDQILESYCNQIYFGSNAYGIELASQTYLAKHSDELTLAEAAFLANLPRWPTHYNPYQDFEIAKERQRIVLRQMVKLGFITEQQHEQAINEPLKEKLRPLNSLLGKATYYVEYVKQLVDQDFSSELLYYGGLQIYTSLDMNMQDYAYEAVQKGLTELDQLTGHANYQSAPAADKPKYLQAALVAIDPRNGKIKAMVGGRDFPNSPFNRAITNNRQPGSAFKPFTYLAAIDQAGYTPASILVDKPVTFSIPNQPDWSPPNFDNQYRGPITLKTALTNSINTVTAQLIDKIHPQVVVEYAHKMGIQSPLEPTLSLALGTSPVSPLELGIAYATFISGGVTRQPQILKFIETSQHEQLKLYMSQGNQVIDPQSIYLVVDMLKNVIENGTGNRVRSMEFNRFCAGKTGTTNDAKDAWFVGFTPQLITVVWVGYDSPAPILDVNQKEITGSRAAIPIWVYFMSKALADEPDRDFAIPSGIEFLYVDPMTGEEVDKNYPNAQQVALKAGTQLPQKIQTE
jgi:1A family penicillin-binding protein